MLLLVSVGGWLVVMEVVVVVVIVDVDVIMVVVVVVDVVDVTVAVVAVAVAVAVVVAAAVVAAAAAAVVVVIVVDVVVVVVAAAAAVVSDARLHAALHVQTAREASTIRVAVLKSTAAARPRSRGVMKRSANGSMLHLYLDDYIDELWACHK